MTLSDFDSIRPVAPEELPAAFDQLMGDESFCAIFQSFFKDVPMERLRERLYSCKDNLEVQKTFFYPLITQLAAKCCTSLTMDAASLPAEKRKESHTFVSNHRDIVLDSAFLCVLLIDNGFGNTTEIAIGDNLLIYPWIKTLVRVNKSFIVRRSASMREMLASSKLMSEYMHYDIAEKYENVWIAQREGRAKDSDDRTQESVLKMMALGGTGSALERLRALNIVPLAISYEYDPCDYLKAKEFQQKRDVPGFKKSQADDLENMRTGIFGYKGNVHYRTCAPVNTWLDELADCPKAEFFKEVAQRMDKEIHSSYQLFAGNFVALDLLQGGTEFAGHYTAEEKAGFEKYLSSRLALIDLPSPDEAFLREKMLTMYANPLLNQLTATRG